MKKMLATFAVSSLIFAASTVGASAASAAIEDAKSRCVVGEQSDGYLGVIDDMAVGETLKREVRTINQQRKAVFADLAARNGVTIEDAAALTGKRLVEGAPSGQCVMLPDGSWARQP